MNMSRIYLVLSVIFRISLAKEESYRFEIDEREVLNKVLLRCETSTLSTIDTKIYLQNLECYYSYPNEVIASPGTIKLISKLIKLPKATPCFKEEVYVNFDQLLESEKGLFNITEFIKHHRRLYTERCNNHLSRLYLKSIWKIPDTSEAEIAEVAEKVEMAAKGKFNPKTPFYSQDALVGGIYSYLIQSGFEDEKESTRIQLSN